MCDVYVLHHGGDTQITAMRAAKRFATRRRVVVHPGSSSIKSQMKKADASGALFAVFATEDECAQGVLGIKRSHARRGGNAFAAQTPVKIEEARRSWSRRFEKCAALKKIGAFSFKKAPQTSTLINLFATPT